MSTSNKVEFVWKDHELYNKLKEFVYEAPGDDVLKFSERE